MVTEDGSIRDDALADFICAQLLEQGLANVADVKFMANSCYGGGLIDDLARVFGPGGACEGVTWVAGSASQPDETAWGWKDSFVNNADNAGKNLGSDWTNSLAGEWRQPDDANDGAIRDGDSSDTVAGDLQEAADNDLAGPNGDELEAPVVASGNGGDSVTWGGADKHEGVVFGGSQTDDRHTNNVENVDGALGDVWGNDTNNINAIDGGTEQELLDAIEAAISRLDSDTQLAIYIDDHGDTEFDLVEFLEFVDETFEPPLTVPPDQGFNQTLPVHDGWPVGIAGNLAQGEPPAPVVTMFIQEPIFGWNWTLVINDQPLPFPPVELFGPVELPIPPATLLQPPPYQLALVSDDPSGLPLILSEFSLDSGPINEVEHLSPDALMGSGFEGWEAFLSR